MLLLSVTSGGYRGGLGIDLPSPHVTFIIWTFNDNIKKKLFYFARQICMYNPLVFTLLSNPPPNEIFFCIHPWINVWLPYV